MKLTGDGAFVPSNSTVINAELSTDENTTGMALTTVICGFHGDGSAKNTAWERNIAETDNGTHWKSASTIEWGKKPKRHCE